MKIARRGTTAPAIGRVLDLADPRDLNAADQLLGTPGARTTFEPVAPAIGIV